MCHFFFIILNGKVVRENLKVNILILVFLNLFEIFKSRHPEREFN